MSTIDLILIIGYQIGILIVGFVKRSGKKSSAVDFLVGGRKLTLPAFIATLVCTWYGGILGVGEYSFKYGISNWLVFGIPYYLAAIIFAFFLASKARRTKFLTIPDRLKECYGKNVAGAGALIIYLITLPTAYILMLGVLCNIFFGIPYWLGILIGTIFSVVYLFLGGFNSVVRTDIIQAILMYLGFAVLLVILVFKHGTFDFLTSSLPATHFTWHGGNSGWYIAIWYVLALATLIEPSFYQRCYAAKSERVAKKGILLSVLFWIVFDFMTTACGLYARALLPETIDPLASYPLLAELVLPPGLYGVFAIALLATVMSTVDSYSFIAATTLGKDIICDWWGASSTKINFYTKLGIFISAFLTIILVIFFDSVVDVWHDLGSIATPMLLVPIVSTFIGKRLMKPRAVLFSMLLSGLITLLWLLSAKFNSDGAYWYSLEPIFVGLLISLLFYLFGSVQIKKAPN